MRGWFGSHRWIRFGFLAVAVLLASGTIGMFVFDVVGAEASDPLAGYRTAE